MPELPDLLYIRKYLRSRIVGRSITGCDVKQPVVLRTTIDEPPGQLLAGRSLVEFTVHGPFITARLAPPLELIINLMLAGRLQHQRVGERPEGYLCLSLLLDDGSRLNLCDEQKMAKAYLVRPGDYSRIPGYTKQGIDILSSGFTAERFRELAAKHGRKQVRVFINDHTILSAIGNAYADEILFESRIHPKTLVARLSREQVDELYNAILSVMSWGIAHVDTAGQPIQVKVREHMKVRNRTGKACLRCGTTIRREGVRGHDVFFCPFCQPPSRELFIDWRKTGR
jgi:formamidopyrimidine-DNA glycosylase